MLVSLLMACGIIALALAALCGLVIGYGIRRCRELLDEMRLEYNQFVAERDVEQIEESAIVDDSPLAVKLRKAEKEQADDEDDGDSQIITTKSPGQRRVEESAATEAKLDKWMPGAKRGSK